MKFSSQRDTLLIPLQHVVGAVERRQTSPILGNVLIDAQADQLSLTATDSEISLQATSPTEPDITGKVTVPARKLLDICKNLPDGGRVDFEVTGDRVKFQSGRSRFTLSTQPVEQFPAVQEMVDAQKIELTAGELNTCMRSTSFSMAQQDVRFYLNGLLVEIDSNKLAAVATDGHRLAYSECHTDADPASPVQAIVPRKSVGELLRLLGTVDAEEPVHVQINDKHLQIAVGTVCLTTKLIDGRFPDYRRVIPTDGDKELLIDSASLRQSLVRASVLSNEKYRGVRLALQSGLLTISTNNPEQEEAIDEMEVDYTGDSAEIGFNVTYLLDVLGALTTDNARIVLKDGGSSALITPDNTTNSQYVIMPMRL